VTTPVEPPVCGCCTFGNHTEPCTCDGTSCCHPAEHGSERNRLRRQLVAVRAEADGWAEALRNAERLYDQHLAEERGKLREAAAWIIRTGYPHDWTGHEHPPPAVWEALVDAVHDDPAGNLHGNSLSREEAEMWMRVETGRPEDERQKETT
jgi:hypothetical protein